jgi:hypothetical protein
MAGIEKRKERRVKTSMPIKIICRSNESSGFTGNISRLGAYAEMDQEFPIGADVHVVLEIPADIKDASWRGNVKCQGNIFRANFVREVNNKKYYSLGIFFTGFAEQGDKERLSRYLDYLITREEKEIEQGAKLWREKREMKKIDKVSTEGRDIGFDNSDIVSLLKQILSQLEEIRSLLKPTAKNK